MKLMKFHNYYVIELRFLLEKQQFFFFFIIIKPKVFCFNSSTSVTDYRHYMLKIPSIHKIKFGCTFFPNMKSTSGKLTLTQAEE